MPSADRGASRGRRLVFALLAVVAALVGLVLWALRDEPTPDRAPGAQRPSTVERPRPAPHPSQPRPQVRRPEPTPTPDPDPAASDAPAAGPRPPVVTAARDPVRLHVTVMRSTGGPGAGAEVLALDPLGEYLRPPAPLVRERGRADADGKADFDLRGGTTVLRVLASLDGESAVSETISADAGREANVRLELRPGVAVKCLVTDLDDVPVQGAWGRITASTEGDTWALKLRAEADPSGTVAFPPLPLGERTYVAIEAGAKSYLTAGQAFRVATLREGPVTLRLPRGVSIRGRAVDERGRPVAGAMVRVLGQDRRETTGDDGRFDIAALPTTGGTLWADAPGFAPTFVRDLRGDGGDVDAGDVVLRVGGTLTAMTVAADLSPVAGAKVVLFHEDDPETILATVESGDDGRVAFEHVPPGPLTLDATEPAGKSSGAAAIHAKATGLQPGATDVRLVLSGAASVYVRFLSDGQRTPVVVSSVKLTAKAVGDTPSELAWAWSGGNIDAVRFEPEHTGTFDVTVEIPGYLPATVERVDVLPDREMRIDVLFRKQ